MPVFEIDGLSSPSGRNNQICLHTEIGWNLDGIKNIRSRCCLVRMMDI